jgi:NAD(P)-dependent dehydrogenase (short-subunit alcohol dehydrogenase family)
LQCFSVRAANALERAAEQLGAEAERAMTVRMDVTDVASITFGFIEVCRVFAPAMAEAHYGRIVNVSSGAGQLATMSTYAPAYSMSKTSLNGFTRILAQTYRDRGVLVNAVDPGWVRTTWAGRRRLAHLRKVPTRLSGLPRCQMMAHRADSSTIGARPSGRHRANSFNDFHWHHSHRR